MSHLRSLSSWLYVNQLGFQQHGRWNDREAKVVEAAVRERLRKGFPQEVVHRHCWLSVDGGPRMAQFHGDQLYREPRRPALSGRSANVGLDTERI